jgi:hypothetical protein
MSLGMGMGMGQQASPPGLVGNEASPGNMMAPVGHGAASSSEGGMGMGMGLRAQLGLGASPP